MDSGENRRGKKRGQHHSSLQATTHQPLTLLRKRRRTEQKETPNEKREEQETEEESDEADALLKDCPHLTGVYFEQIHPIVLDPVTMMTNNFHLTLP